MRCLLLLALTGCFHTKMVTTEHQVEAHWTPVKVGKVGPLELRVTDAHGTLYIGASRSRECYQELRGTFEHRREEVVEADAYLNAGLVLAALPVVLIDYAITSNSLKKPTVERYRVINPIRVACPAMAAQVGLDVSLPSGATIHTSTDANGALALTIPSTEPAQGVVVFHAPGLDESVSYGRQDGVAFAPPSANAAFAATSPGVVMREPPPSESKVSVADERAALEQRGFRAVRDALRACGDRQGVHGVVTAQLAIDAQGRVTSSLDRGGPAFATCVNAALTDARFPGEHAQKLVFPYHL